MATNLVSNAIFYNRPGGEVRVTLANTPDGIKLTVSGTGQGIAAADLPHIFERFYRADGARFSAAGNVGLGLSISKAIIESHGGTIEAASMPSRGSTFTVHLPS